MIGDAGGAVGGQGAGAEGAGSVAGDAADSVLTKAFLDVGLQRTRQVLTDMAHSIQGKNLTCLANETVSRSVLAGVAARIATLADIQLIEELACGAALGALTVEDAFSRWAGMICHLEDWSIGRILHRVPFKLAGLIGVGALKSEAVVLTRAHLEAKVKYVKGHRCLCGNLRREGRQRYLVQRIHVYFIQHKSIDHVIKRPIGLSDTSEEHVR